MYTIKNTTGGCGVKGASGAGIAPPGNPGDILYLISSGVAGAASNVLYTGDGNLYAANSVTTTNVFATRYYGDGGLLSNISSSAITQPFANLVVSNSVTTTNVFATTANVGTLNVWQVSNLSSLSLGNNLYAANAVTTANVFVHDTLSVDGSMTANSVNTVFFFDTLTIPFVTTSNLTVSNLIASTGNVNVYGNVITNGYIQATEYYGDGGFLSNISSSAITQPFANLVVSNSVTTTNVFALSANLLVANIANIYTTNIVGFIGSQWTTGTGNVYYLDGVGIGTGSVTSNLTVQGNVYVSNAVTTTNVFAGTYYGDGGLLSNVFVQPFANLVVSNSVTTTNIFATSANIATMNVGYLTVNSAVVYGTSTLNVYGTSNLTNVTVTDTFNVNGSMTANAANATFFFDTFTIPYINTQDLNVSSVMTFTGPLATFSNLYVPGAANIEYLSVSNLAVTGNLYITATNVQTTNALTINNSGTMTAFKVTQNETSIHTHNVAEFWDATTLAMVIDPAGNVGIHTTVSPGYALTVTDPANFETLYIRGKTGTASLNVTGNIIASNAVTTTNVFATRYYGDGGLLSNISSSAITQPFANLVVSNAVTTTNVFATTANVGTLNVWQVSNLSSLSLGNNLYAANAVTTTNLFANTLTLTGLGGQTTLYVRNNVFVSDTVTKSIDNTSLAMYVGGGTISSTPTRAINTYSTSYPTFLATGSSHFYFNDVAAAQTLTSTAGADAYFGLAVALSSDGNTALVGAPFSSTNAGYAAVYRFTNGAWGSAQTLTSTAGASARFGYATALSSDGNTALIGGTQASSDAGYAAVYRFTNGAWGSAQTLTSTADPTAYFGGAVSISSDGNTVLVGATLHSSSTGYAAVFRFTGGSWGPAQTLTSTAGAGALFGNSVFLSADGNTALVGAPYSATNAGYAAVYRFTNGSWGSAQTLTSTAGASAYFGESVTISADGNTAIVGGSNGDGGNGYAAVYKFTNGAWGSASPISSTIGAGSSFGGAVSISADGNTALVGAMTASSDDGYAAVFLLGPKFLVNNTLSVYNTFVGIANTTPTSTLHVSGNIYASNAVTTTNLFATTANIGTLYTTQVFGTSQGVLYTYSAATTALPTAFSSGTAGPSISGYHINLSGFAAESAQSVTQFSASTGLLKFNTTGLYQITCVFVADQPVAKVAIGKTTAYTTWTAPTGLPGSVATAGYDYVYNYPVGSSPSEVVTLPINVTDISQYYYLDLFLSTVAGTPSVLYPTRSTTAVGTAYGTYVQVSPFGNYLTSASGIASALLCNCAPTSNLSGVYSSNAYRIALTTSNGWTVNGTSTSLAVTANGNFQVNQSGIYEVNMCLNTVGNTPVQFQIGSLSSDTDSPGAGTQYLYTYAPMYTQDPTTVIQLPLNITNISNVYFVECSFAGTVTGNVALNATSTFVSVKPIGGYINTGTNPWTQQGTSVYYNGGPVGVGGVNPSSLTETFTVSGTSAFVSNVTVTSDASGNAYVLADRVPTGSLHVSSYVTGSVPLTTTTNLIQNYLSNAATISANTSTGSITQALNLPGVTNSNSFLNFPPSISATFSNLALSNLFIEAWVNPTLIAGANRTILQRNLGGTADFYFFVNTSGILSASILNTSGATAASASSATTISTSGSWVHVAFSYARTGTTTGTLYVFVNGVVGATTGTVSTQPRVTPTANICIGGDTNSTSMFVGNVADVRVMTNCIVPITTFVGSPQSAPFTTAPTYRTGMNTGYTSNLTLALNSQYFPGASTSPYGPCLTLPGTVGSYYLQTGSPLGQNWKTYGFTLEGWINYPTFASSNIFQTGPLPFTIMQAAGTVYYDWALGATTTGQLAFWFNGGGTYYAIASPANSLVTGQWAHIAVQTTSTALSLYINGAIQTLTQYNVTGGTSTASAYPSGFAPQLSAVGVGLNNGYYGYNNNFAIAKARIVYGSATTTGNVYSMSGFTVSPNLGAIPSGATVAWSLDSQFPLPTYPSIQDVTQIPLQASSYGARPTPVGGVTSNVLGPYTQFDSIRFDGTGYIDYGNAASSVMTTNLWANAWTIEGWVYPTLLTGNIPIYSRSSYGTTNSYDLLIYSQGTSLFAYAGTFTSATSALSLNTWQHIAVTYDGTQSNIYVGGTYKNGGTLTPFTYTPTYGTLVGAWGPGVATAFGATTSYQGNLADVRVSNVARYTGSTYTVPTEPHPTNNANTLLLLRSLAGQVGTTLQVQGRGLNAVSLGATRSVQSYPPAPMSSYLLDTTSNASVSYGVGKYVASASSEYTGQPAWLAFDGNGATTWACNLGYTAGAYTGSVVTVDTLGNAYAGEWIQVQTPVSVILSSYSLVNINNTYQPTLSWLLGSRDGINWTLVFKYAGSPSGASSTYTVSATQGYNYYRLVVGSVVSANATNMYSYVLNGTEESLCITSDAKVGVGIANPQRALEVAGDLVVGGTISGGAGMGSFRNRIINGDMRIAQRGTSFTGGGYTVDRWYEIHQYPTATVTQSSLAAGDAPATQSGLQYYYRIATTGQQAITDWTQVATQFIEGLNIADLNWGTPYGSPVTVSFWYRSTTPGNHYFNISNGGFSSETYLYSVIFPVNTSAWQYYTFTIPPPPNGSSWPTTNATGLKLVFMLRGVNVPAGKFASDFSWQAVTGSGSGFKGFIPAGNVVNFYGQPGSIDLTGVQLEKGTVATPFEFRPYATELALCQRYYQKSYSIGTAPGTATETGNWAYYLPVAIGSTNNWIQSGPNLQASMRTAPAIVLYNSAGNVTTAWNALDGSTGTAWRYLNNTSGGSLGPAFLGYGWTASAEL